MEPAPSPPNAVSLAAAAAAREGYGRLRAHLARRFGDLAAAEDALGDALAQALVRWPVQGIPRIPEAWLLAVARRNLLQTLRHANVVHAHAEAQAHLAATSSPVKQVLPDHRLALMFACARPEVERSMRSALMLQVVLGLQVKQMAGAFLMGPEALTKRLVRAKASLREAGARFELPEADVLGARLPDVLEAIYGAYTVGTDGGALDADGELRDEALYLARLCAGRMPDEPEALGLLALLLGCEARREAATDANGAWVDLASQDTGRWNRSFILQAGEHLMRAASLRRPGAFQLEAAIHAAHNQRAFTGSTPWASIEILYSQLVRTAPTLGAHVAHAVAVAYAHSPTVALAQLDRLESQAGDHQPYWAARAHVLELAGHPAAADAAYGRAVGLTMGAQQKRHLEARRAALAARTR